MDKDEVLVICNHHRKLPFFEEGIRHLQRGGYNRFLILNTGLEPWTKFSMSGVETYDAGSHLNYFQGCILYKDLLETRHRDVKYIVHLDSDLFLTDHEHFTTYLNEVDSGNFDFASYYSHNYHLESYAHNFGTAIAAAIPQQILDYSPDPDVIWDSAACPGVFPWPYWENSYLVITREMWDRLSRNDVSHGRWWIKSMMEKRAKMAVLRTSYLTSERYRRGHNGTRPVTHYGREWFHIGDYTYYYYAMESGNYGIFPRFDRSFYTQVRVGLMLSAARTYGLASLPAPVADNLSRSAEMAGGEVACLKAWRETIQGTCMEGVVLT